MEQHILSSEFIICTVARGSPLLELFLGWIKADAHGDRGIGVDLEGPLRALGDAVLSEVGSDCCDAGLPSAEGVGDVAVVGTANERTVLGVGVVDEAVAMLNNYEVVTEGVALEESCQYAQHSRKGARLLTFPLVARVG